MQVETYEVTESTGDESTEHDNETYLALVEELGLEGQRTLLRSADDGHVRVIPYRNPTLVERNVYGILFPSNCLLENYEEGHIPIRVLQVASHAKQLGLVCWVQYPKSGSQADDPILIGVPDTHQYARTCYANCHNKDRYILARWGDCLLPFAELKAKAVQIFQEKALAKISRLRSNVEAAYNTIKAGSDWIDIEGELPSEWRLEHGQLD